MRKLLHQFFGIGHNLHVYDIYYRPPSLGDPGWVKGGVYVVLKCTGCNYQHTECFHVGWLDIRTERDNAA